MCLLRRIATIVAERRKVLRAEAESMLSKWREDAGLGWGVLVGCVVAVEEPVKRLEAPKRVVTIKFVTQSRWNK